MAVSHEEWPLTLDAAAVVADGWHPFPFCEFIVKIHSRCNLACDYCYMYEMADQSWRDKPYRMSAETARQIASRIAEHTHTHKLREISLILHGGEPMLAGHEFIQRLVIATREAAGPGVQVNAQIQTNAIGLNESYLRLFHQLGLKVGVSIDGGTDAHNRHRRFADGRNSYTEVSAALGQIRHHQYRHLFSGLLCTIDLRNDPEETYQALAEFDPPMIDFLLPHGTWDAPPPGWTSDPTDTPYGNWLAAVFDIWYVAPRTRIRMFEEIIRLLLGSPASSETVGLAPARMVVVETDGSIEQVDTMKAAYHGAPVTGLHVARDSFDAALLHPGVMARQLGIEALSTQCRRCPFHQTCGGGLFAHRYRAGTGFANPSVYCTDLSRTISHIARVVQTDVDERLGTMKK